MCGIVGWTERQGCVNPERLRTMRDTMRHRGPDDAGLWVSPSGRVGLAHRRLAILDLSPRGRQPMHRGDNLVTVFNGEIYNYRDLRDKLRGCGHSFVTDTDTEVLLAAYEEWGTNCLHELDGMYAFCLYDRKKDSLFLARDRVGEKPLYYCHDDHGFLFASELKALFANLRVRRVMDPTALCCYLTFSYIPRDLCIIRGIRKLMPGCALQYGLDNHETTHWRYWSLPATVEHPFSDLNEATDRFDEMLTASVNRCLHADVPVGIMLSGGLDSSLVASAAARISSEPVKTFTISFPGHGRFDEAPHARMVADHLGTEHFELAAEPATVSILEDLAVQYDEPFGDSSLLPTYLVSRLIRRHVTVALGGDGGDELFGGYPQYSRLQRMHRYCPRLPAICGRAIEGLARRSLPVGTPGRNWIALCGLPEVQRIPFLRLYFDRMARDWVLGPTAQRLVSASVPTPETTFAAWNERTDSPLRMATSYDFRHYLAEDILTKVDRASMLTSLEVRAPFLAREILEFAFGRLPDSFRATASERKLLPKTLAARHLPPQYELARKQGFSIPLDRWIAGEWGGFCRDVLREAPPALLSQRAVDRLFFWQKRGARNANRIFVLVMLELWRRHYRVEIEECP